MLRIIAVALLLIGSASAQVSKELSPPRDVSRSTVRATGSTKARTNAARAADVVNVKDYGARGDCVTDDYQAIIDATYAATTAGKALYLPTACYRTGTTIAAWMWPHLRVMGNGSRIKFTGTGKILNFHSSAVEVDDITIDDLVLQGTSLATHGFYSDTLIARSKFKITNIQDVTTVGAYIGDVQLSTLNVSVSSILADAMGTPQTTAPITGIVVGDLGIPVANVREATFQAEGASSIGIHFRNAVNGCVVQGTSESNGGWGIVIDSRSWGNTFVGFDLEANATGDVVDSGGSSVWVNSVSVSAGGFVFGTGAHDSTIIGGAYNGIEVQTGTRNIQMHNFSYANGVGGVINIAATSLYPVVNGVYNINTGVIYTAGPSVQSNGYIRISSQSTNAASRDYGILTDASNVGFFEVWRGASQGASPLGGVPVLAFNASNEMTVGVGFTTVGSIAFASLGTHPNGSLTYCTDCTVANPCAAGGTGAIAKRINGAWVCN